MRQAFTAFVFFFLFCGQMCAQETAKQYGFKSIPAGDRERFQARLEIYLEYHRTKNWPKLFDMFPRIHTQHPEITKASFLADIRKYGKDHVVAMSIQDTISNESIDGQYAIWGCAKVKNGWFTSKWQSTIYASLENNEWVFSDIKFSYQLEARDPLPCKFKK